MKFKVGDRIKAVDDLMFAKKGDTGTIIFIYSYNNQIAICWDRNCGGWATASNVPFKIPYGRGEYVHEQDIELYNVPTYELHIMCKDEVTTNCIYKENGKIVNRSSTRRNVKEDEFDFKEAVKNCIERVGLSKDNDEAVEKIDDSLVGKKFKTGQRVRVLNTEMHHYKENYANLDLYIGETGHFKENGEFKEDNYVSSIEFDNPILNKIDNKNGYLCWNWSEVELID